MKYESLADLLLDPAANPALARKVARAFSKRQRRDGRRVRIAAKRAFLNQ